MTADDPLLELLASRAYRRGQFTLASGRSSEHYVNCKPVTLSGRGAQLLAPKLLALVEPNAVAVAGLTLGADPMVSWVAHAAALRGRGDGPQALEDLELVLERQLARHLVPQAQGPRRGQLGRAAVAEPLEGLRVLRYFRSKLNEMTVA